MKFKSKKTPHRVIINNIIKPIKVKKDEKIIFVVGDENEIPPEDVMKRLADDLSYVGIREILIPAAIKLYIVDKDTKIELYNGSRLNE